MTMTRTQQQSSAEIISDGSLGLFTVISIVLLLWGALWLRDNYHMHAPRFINVYFHDIAQLSDSANVFMDGVRVGTVEKLHWQGDHRVMVQLRITNYRVRLPVGSHFDILNNGIVGAKYVEIIVPDHKPQDPELPELASNCTVEGEDPVRPELALNNLVVGLSRIDTVQLGKNFDSDRARLCRAADQLAMLADKSMPVVEGALPLEHDLHQLTTETTKVTQHLNHFIDNPKLSSDLKDTVQMAKDTVETVKATMHELDTTLKDKDLRADIIAALNALHHSTQELERTVKVVQSITGDQKMRDDVKGILDRANIGLTKVDKLFKSPGYGSDLKETLTSTREAIGHIDLAARQLNQILDKRAPLMHLMLGRPGLIKEIKESKPKAKKKAFKGITGEKDSTNKNEAEGSRHDTNSVYGKERAKDQNAPSP
jgi:ABC-type transporter Mla subunit MlaD